MIKNTLLFFLLTGTPLFGQDLYLETENETSGMPMASMTKSKTRSYYSPGKSKVITRTALGQEQTVYTTGEQMTVVNPGFCGSFTADEFWREELGETANTRILKFEKSEETREILGYTCKKAQLTVESSSPYGTVTSEVTAWYNEDFKKYTVQGLSEHADEYIKTLAELGAIFESETSVSGITVVTRVTKLLTDPLPASTFEIKGCKKPLNAKDYKKEQEKRNNRDRMSGF